MEYTPQFLLQVLSGKCCPCETQQEILLGGM